MFGFILSQYGNNERKKTVNVLSTRLDFRETKNTNYGRHETR